MLEVPTFNGIPIAPRVLGENDVLYDPFPDAPINEEYVYVKHEKE
jgi:hypothetical protein